MDMHPRVKYSFTLDAKSKAIEVYNREIVLYTYFLAGITLFQKCFIHCIEPKGHR